MVLDNFSRRILAWQFTENFSVATTVAILREADWGAARREEASLGREAGGQQGGCMWRMPIAGPIDPIELRDGIEIMPVGRPDGITKLALAGSSF